MIRSTRAKAGVRNLERELSRSDARPSSSCCWRRPRRPCTVDSKNLDKYLGVRRFRYGKAEESNRVGQVTGLAGPSRRRAPDIEAAVVAGKGKLTHTASSAK